MSITNTANTEIVSTTMIIAYIVSSLSSCNWGSSSDVVGATATMDIKFTSSFPILSNSQILIYMSGWGPSSTNNFMGTPVCSNIQNLISSSMSCSYTSESGFVSQSLTVSPAFASNFSSTTNF